VSYAVIYERAANNYAAYVPDLPGCVATGSTRQEVEHRIRAAIELHLEGMREDGETPPLPTTAVGSVEAE
jgi:predicted RNase H-like HicB family nuclease